MLTAMKRCRLGLLFVILCALSGCAQLPAGAVSGTPAVQAPVAQCMAAYRTLDVATARAGVRDAGASRINGFPYLRVNRLLASYRKQNLQGEALTLWLQAMARLDVQARRVELTNLGVPELAQQMHGLARCSSLLVARDLATPARLELLHERARVPDDYSLVQRSLGLYPVALPFLRHGVADYQAQRQAAYRQPLPTQGELLVWQPGFARPQLAAASIAHWLQQRDALGRPALTAAQWQQLTRQFAPVWWLQTHSRNDVPGAPYFQPNGLPGVNTLQPRVYYYHQFMRWHGQLLAQLVYVIWFAARPAQGPFDPYAGRMDGLVWRVTLGSDGQVLTYDSIHPCGCFHAWYTVAPLQLRKPKASAVEPPLLLQRHVTGHAVAVRLQARDHLVRRVVPAAQASGTSFSYQLRPYRELLTLPWPQGGTRSLFGPDGIVAGSGRLERYWLWPSGVVSPGAMRQRGRHAIAFVGQQHFDDPGLLMQTFQP